MAPQELEKSASKYATDAIKYDSQGTRGMAITNYQKATESLLKLTIVKPCIVRSFCCQVPPEPRGKPVIKRLPQMLHYR